MNGRKLLKKIDLIIICVIIAVALGVYAAVNYQGGSGPARCRILFDGKVVNTVSLGKNGVFTISEAPEMEFEIKDNLIAVLSSDCKDKVCVRSGFIGRAGQKLVCLPNKVVVSIDSDNAGLDELDAVAR